MPKFSFEDLDFSQLAAGSRTQEKREKPVPKPTSDFGAVMGALGSLGSAAVEGYVNTKRLGQQRTIDAISRAATMANMGLAIPGMEDLPQRYVEPLREVAALRQEKEKAEIERLRNPQAAGVKQAEHYYAKDPESSTGYSLYLVTFGKDGVPQTKKNEAPRDVAEREIERTERTASGPIGKTAGERAFDSELYALQMAAAGWYQDKRTNKWMSSPNKAKPEWQALYKDMIARYGNNPSRKMRIDATKVGGLMVIPVTTMTEEELIKQARGE